MKIIDEFEEAVRQHTWKGAMPPEAWEDIEADYNETKQRLIRRLRTMNSVKQRLRETIRRLNGHVSV